jgi:hypothetical protein
MTQLFRDCYRDIQRASLISAIAFWRRMIWDVIRTAPLERWEALGRRYKIMKSLKSDLIGLLACIAILIVMFLLLGYLRKHQVALMLGYSLDAIITAGIVSNLIIFPLTIATRLSAFRTVWWTLLLVNGALLLIATLIGNRVDPGFSFPAVAASYLVSFVFWLTFHWLRSHMRPQVHNEIFLFDSRDFFAAVANVLRQNLQHKRTDRGDAEAVWKVVVQNCHLRSGNNKYSTGRDIQSRNLVRSDVSAR